MAEKIVTEDDISLSKARYAKKLREVEGYLDPDAQATRRPPQPPPRRSSVQNGGHTSQEHRRENQEHQQGQQVAQNERGYVVTQQAVPQTQAQKHPVVVEDPLRSIEWEYVEEPDDSLLCEICFSVMTDPRLLNCCGEHNACKRCVDRASVLNTACPFCRSENFKLIPNNDLKVAIENVKVWCPNKAEGCKWSGRMNEASVHLKKCEHTTMLCPRACGLKLKRNELDEHKRTCFNQPVSCRYAVIGCEETFPQKDASHHNKDNMHKHLLQITNRNEAIRRAAFSSSQAVDRSVQKSLAERSAKIDGLKRHLANSQQTVKSLQQKIDNAKKCLYTIREVHQSKGVQYTAELQAKGKEVLRQLTISRSIEGVIDKMPVPYVEGYTAIPITFTIDNFGFRKQNDEEWVSPPFYTHVAGYKMCLAIYPNGSNEGRGTHLSVFLHMMQGENDNYLPWPFPGGVITILFINQRGVMKNMVLESFGHASLYATIQSNGSPFCQRVTDGTRGSGWGYNKAIANSQIGRYVVNDILRVKVHKIDFLPL